MNDLVDQNSANPTRKVSAGAIGGAISAIVAWGLSETVGLDIPAEVAIAFSTIISFVLSYFVRDREV